MRVGIDIKVAEGNTVVLPDDTQFSRSKIHVSGRGNIVEISSALQYDNLSIVLRGNNKKITIGRTGKNINNLKIVSIRGDAQEVSIGTDFSCGGLEIQMNDGHESLSIGDDCLFSWGIKIRTSDGHSIIDLDTGLAINVPKDVFIGSHVWVCEDARFLKGSCVPSFCVVGSASIVTKNFGDDPGYCVIAGFPAKVVRRNISWDHRAPSVINALAY